MNPMTMNRSSVVLCATSGITNMVSSRMSLKRAKLIPCFRMFFASLAGSNVSTSSQIVSTI